MLQHVTFVGLLEATAAGYSPPKYELVLSTPVSYRSQFGFQFGTSKILDQKSKIKNLAKPRSDQVCSC